MKPIHIIMLTIVVVGLSYLALCVSWGTPRPQPEGEYGQAAGPTPPIVSSSPVMTSFPVGQREDATPSHLQIRVVDDAAQPLPDSLVAVSLASSRTRAVVIAKTTTDEAGRASLEAAILPAVGAMLRVSRNGFAPVSRELPTGSGEVTIVMGRGHNLVLKAVDGNGLPIQGACFTMSSAAISTTYYPLPGEQADGVGSTAISHLVTGATGMVEALSIAAGTYYLRCTHAHYVTAKESWSRKIEVPAVAEVEATMHQVVGAAFRFVDEDVVTWSATLDPPGRRTEISSLSLRDLTSSVKTSIPQDAWLLTDVAVGQNFTQSARLRVLVASRGWVEVAVPLQSLATLSVFDVSLASIAASAECRCVKAQIVIRSGERILDPMGSISLVLPGARQGDPPLLVRDVAGLSASWWPVGEYSIQVSDGVLLAKIKAGRATPSLKIDDGALRHEIDIGEGMAIIKPLIVVDGLIHHGNGVLRLRAKDGHTYESHIRDGSRPVVVPTGVYEAEFFIAGGIGGRLADVVVGVEPILDLNFTSRLAGGR